MHRTLKQLLGIGLLALLLIAGLPGVAGAHELKVDGSIAAVLHTDPDDNPVTGSPTKYIITFADTTNRFSLSKCNCTLSFIDNGQVIFSKKLATSNDFVSKGSYTFTNAAVYTMRFTGVPKKPDGFQPFVLDYTLRVAHDQASTQQSMPAVLWAAIGMCIGLILLVSYRMNRAQ